VLLNGDALCELAAQFLALAEKRAATVPLMLGHRVMAVALASTGDIAQGRAHHDQALALYDPVKHRALATHFGVESRVSILGFRSLVLWFLGYHEAALADAAQAVREARETGQAAALMYALYHTGLTQTFCGNHTTATMQFNELVAMADKTRSIFWKAGGAAPQGWALVTGNASQATEMITAGIISLRSTGTTVWIPLFLTYLAKGHAELGQFVDASRAIDEALTLIETSKERWYEAETDRVAGEIELLLPESDAQKAEGYFERALSVARGHQAKSLELRAAMSMARLWRDQGKPQQAHDLLAPVYGWFTEEFETLDLKEARALLDERHKAAGGRRRRSRRSLPAQKGRSAMSDFTVTYGCSTEILPCQHEKNKPCLGPMHRGLSFVNGSRFPLTSGRPRSKPWLTLRELLTGSSFATRVTDIN
jgi:predicted ATPase